MEQGKGAVSPVHWPSSLEVPATEIVDLLSDEEDATVLPPNQPKEATRDASDNTAVEDGDEGGDDQLSIWEDIVSAEESDGADFEIDGGCTLEQGLAFRKRLKLIGEDRFIKETVEAGVITAKKLITAFGIRPPAFLEGFPDHTFYPVLSLAICRELSKRDKLPQYNTIDDTVNLLKKSSNVIVLTGAGISTSLGIPDFRSKENGLYTQLAHLGLSDPQEVFDISLFREDPTIFYSVAKDILPSSKKFSPTHAFIKLLQDKNKLLTNFTQNIDNLESHAGILPEKLIQCHGSFASATCIECKAHVPGDAIYKDLKAGRVARCDECLRQIRSVQDGGKRKRKRPSPPVSGSKSRKKRRSSFSDTDSNEDDNIAVAGVMKPDITFFGEDLPKAFHHRLMDHDKDKVDLVLVIGTSLKVAPVSEVVGVLPKDVPQIYINRDPCGHVNFDVDILGECDTVVAELCRRAGWDLKHEMCTDDGIDVRLKEGAESQWHVRRVKSEDKVERQENGALGNGVNTEESSFLLSSDAGRGEVSVDSPASFGNSTFVAAGAGGTFSASRNTRRETNTKLDDDEPESDLIARQDVENGNTVFEGSGLQVEDEKDGTEYWFPLKAGSADREPKREASDSRLQ